MGDIQQLIKIFSATKNQEVYKDITEHLKTQEKLWIAFSPATRNYYLDYIKGAPSVFVFSKKEYCKAFQDYLLQQYIKIEIVENNTADRVKIFSDFYRSGFECVVVDNGQTFLNMSLFDIIEKPDFSNVPEAERPVFNPSLVCAANRFFQALSGKKSTRDMEYDMLSEIYKGKYLLPVDIQDMQTDGAAVKKDSTISVPAITSADGKKIIPFFTDWNEMAKYDKDKKFKGFVTTFKDIENFCKKGDCIAINPFGVNMLIDNNTVNIIESVVKNRDNDSGEKAVVFELDIYPEKMTESLNEYFDKCGSVKAAYMKGMRKSGVAGYLIIIDFEGEKNPVFGGAAEAVKPHTEGLPVYFAKYESSFGKSAVGTTKPFYQKIKLDV